MKIHIKIVALLAFAVVGSCLIAPRTAAAADPRPITIDGVVYDKKHKPVPGVTVVAWCGGIDFFGGSGTTDANGHYIIKTDGDACPFDNELTVTTDIDYDTLSDGARHTQVHTKTTINIYLGEYTSVAVPEYGWLTAGGTTLASLGALGYIRRRYTRPATTGATPFRH